MNRSSIALPLVLAVLSLTLGCGGSPTQPVVEPIAAPAPAVVATATPAPTGERGSDQAVPRHPTMIA